MSENEEAPQPEDNTAADFASAAEESTPSLLQEFLEFLRENKAWWLVPILLALAFIGVAVWLGGSAVAPFIYPLF